MKITELFIVMASSNSGSTSSSTKHAATLTMDKAAFLLIRIKRAFLKKRNKGRGVVEKPPGRKKPPPLLRARTLPAIICPSLNIIQAQLEANSQLTNPKTGNYTVNEEVLATKPYACSPRASVSSLTSATSSVSSHQSSLRDSAKHRYDTTKSGLAKIAKLLGAKEKSTNTKMVQPVTVIPNIEVTPLRRSGSVDSVMECSNYHIDISDRSSCSSITCLAPSTSSINVSVASPLRSLAVPFEGRTIPTSPSVPAKLEAHRKGDIPSSPSVPNKLAKGASGICLENKNFITDPLSLSKAERKRLEKADKMNIDLQALFVSVEHQQLERAKTILATTDVNVNCANSEGFTPLDIAVMTLDISMARLLQSYGAKESTKFRSKESRFANLMQIVRDAERCVEELTTCVLNAAAGGNLSMALIKEKEKQLSLWKRRQKLLTRMKSGFEKIACPGPPSYVTLEVVGTKSLRVKFTEPETASSPETVVTKYKVEWSVKENFVQLSGSREMMNLQRLEMLISDVTHGVPYYVRVAAGNLKGYGPYTTATPPFAVPSSWMDVDGKRSRSLGRLCQLDCIFHQIIFSRPPCSSEIKDSAFSSTLETPQQQRRHVRKSIKNLFTSTPKFHKVMKRGVYLATLLYSESRVLVTSDDMLPIMEVDEHCPSNLHNDFHWLMKVACTWEDAKALRAEMEKSHSSSALHFRSKLLQAAEMMQASLGMQDLGQFYYKPLKDADDTTVICTVKFVPDTKSLTNLSLRWMPLTKLQRKLSINSISSTLEVPSMNSTLLSSVQSMMTFNQVSRLPLPRGLYMAYVKISSSVELISVLVPKKAPNVLPYYRIRENPHVSCEEWSWLKMLANDRKPDSASECQLKFQRSLSSAARSLISLLEIPIDQASSQRLYDAEVVELNPDVSLILVLPPVESFCSAPGQKDCVTERDDCLLLPVQVFEMIHMNTYQPLFISRYSRISSILEMDTIVANHFHREAFSSSELSSAKSRLRQLQQFQSQVDNTWRSMRWLMDVLNYAREKQPSLGISLEKIFVGARESPCVSESSSPQQSPVRHTLQIPSDDMVCTKNVERCGEYTSIKISNSSSSFSLTNSSDFLSEGRATNEIRRCASTSGLLQASSSTAVNSEQSASSLCLSVEAAEVPCVSEKHTEVPDPVPSETEDSVGHEDCRSLNDAVVGYLGNDGIVINVTDSSDAWSIPEITLPDENYERLEEEDDVSSTKGEEEQEEDEVASDDEGLLFRNIPESAAAAAANDDDEENPEEAENTADDSELCQDVVCSESLEESNFLKVFFQMDEEESQKEVCVCLHLDADACVSEIIDKVVEQSGGTITRNENDENAAEPDSKKNLSLVLVHDSEHEVLADSFQPLSVQNPWTRGKLLLRRS